MRKIKKETGEISSWPKLSTISLYTEAPQRIFSSGDRKFDISDMLAADLKEGERRTAFVGVAMPHRAWEMRGEENLQSIEERMRYLFEFEGYGIAIERISKESDPWYTHEFVWKLEFWMEM